MPESMILKIEGGGGGGVLTKWLTPGAGTHIQPAESLFFEENSAGLILGRQSGAFRCLSQKRAATGHRSGGCCLLSRRHPSKVFLCISVASVVKG